MIYAKLKILKTINKKLNVVGRYLHAGLTFRGAVINVFAGALFGHGEPVGGLARVLITYSGNSMWRLFENPPQKTGSSFRTVKVYGQTNARTEYV